MEQALAGIEAELERLRTNPPSAEEMERAQRSLIERRDIALQRQSARAGYMVFDELYGAGYDATYRHAEQIEAVTAEAVREVAERYLDPSRAIVVITRPPEGEGEASRRPLSRLQRPERAPEGEARPRGHRKKVRARVTVRTFLRAGVTVYGDISTVSIRVRLSPQIVTVVDSTWPARILRGPSLCPWRPETAPCAVGARIANPGGEPHDPSWVSAPGAPQRTVESRKLRVADAFPGRMGASPVRAAGAGRVCVARAGVRSAIA